MEVPCQWWYRRPERSHGVSSFYTLPVSEAQSAVLRNMRDAYRPFFRSVGEPPPASGLGRDRDQGGLRALCCGSGSYSVRCDVQPCAEESVSWLPVNSEPVVLAAVRPEADRSWLTHWKSCMLRTDDDCRDRQAELGLSRESRYTDDILKYSKTAYVGFLRQLLKRRMIHLRRGGLKAGNLGIFCVSKKNGQLRLISDTSFLNSFFAEPPQTNLP